MDSPSLGGNRGTTWPVRRRNVTLGGVHRSRGSEHRSIKCREILRIKMLNNLQVRVAELNTISPRLTTAREHPNCQEVAPSVHLLNPALRVSKYNRITLTGHAWRFPSDQIIVPALLQIPLVSTLRSFHRWSLRELLLFKWYRRNSTVVIKVPRTVRDGCADSPRSEGTGTGM